MTAHEHESWQLQDSPGGGRYCAACGEKADTTDDTTPEPYTPTDEDVRSAWTRLARAVDAERGRLREDPQSPAAEFDRWLAAHDARVRAEAWDAAVASLCYPDGSPVEVLSNGNPYRSTEEGSTP